jgi:nitrate/TMAO reductase-like tetraheme cytochrome c subunit
LKNKWSKLKAEYSCWKTLFRQIDLGWDETKQNINMAESWWKKARKTENASRPQICFVKYMGRF